MQIYSVSDRYISYLRSDPYLSMVLDNKYGARNHTRKYLGVVIVQNGFNYFVPFSSPKNTDYVTDTNGRKTIRRSIVPIIRMVTTDTSSGEPELKGTLKLNNMIPVPCSELTAYDISQETDYAYKQVVAKEWEYISKNQQKINKNASIIYKQRTSTNKHGSEPGYLAHTIDFAYAEQKCADFIQTIMLSKPSNDIINESQDPSHV